MLVTEDIKKILFIW